MAKNRAVNKQDGKQPPRAESERNEHAQFGPPWTGFHTDITAAHNPPFVSLLRAVDVPPLESGVGDTSFADLVAAYHGLPADLRETVDGLRAIHKEPNHYVKGVAGDATTPTRRTCRASTRSRCRPSTRLSPFTRSPASARSSCRRASSRRSLGWRRRRARS